MSDAHKATIVHHAEPPKGGIDLLAAHEKAQDAMGEHLKAIPGVQIPGQQPVASASGPQKIDPDTLAMVAQDSVLIRTPKGAYVEVGPPPIATAFQVSQILSSGSQSDNVTGTLLVIHDMNTVRALLYVRAINGNIVQMPRNMPEAMQLLNFLGDGGMDAVSLAIQKFWPAPTPEDLPVLKKNLREY